MADLKAEFETAVANSKTLGERPDNTTLLKIYGLYKQATAGDVAEKKPGFSDMIGLPQGEPAFARGDHDIAQGRSQKVHVEDLRNASMLRRNNAKTFSRWVHRRSQL